MLLATAATGSSPKILYPSQFACHACLACQSYALQEGVTSLGKAAKQQNDNVIASTKKRQKTILANNNPSNQQASSSKHKNNFRQDRRGILAQWLGSNRPSLSSPQRMCGLWTFNYNWGIRHTNELCDGEQV